MKILHVVYSLEFGGIETMLVNIANEQVSMGYNVSILCINNHINDALRETIDKRVKFYCLGRPIGSKNPYYILKFNYKLYKLKADIIHIHTASIIRYFISKRFFGKICLTKHDVKDDNYLHYYSNIYSISNTVKEYLKNEYKLDSKVIINGINVHKIDNIKKDNQSDKFSIVQVSTLNHEIKGQHILIEAIKLVKEKGYNVSADFIGDGHSFEYLYNLIKELGLEDNVKLLGTKPQKYIFEHLCEYDLFVQPSIIEGFGLTVAEAMAAKVPVLVSENQGPLEIIDNGKYGYYFKNGDAEDCADKIINIIEQGVDKDMIEAAYKRVGENYSVKQTAINYINEYKKLVSL